MDTIAAYDAIAAYIGAGLFAGWLMNAAIPAINWLGITYIAATWPIQIYCAPVEQQCEFSPEWAFTIGGEA